MAKKNGFDEQFPNFKKFVTVILAITALLFFAVGMGLFGGGFNIKGILSGIAVIGVGVGFWFNAKWARIIVGIGILLGGLYIAIAPIVNIIAAGPVGSRRYDPFFVPPLLMAVIVFFGFGIAAAGVGVLLFVFEKKSALDVGEPSVAALNPEPTPIPKPEPTLPSTPKLFYNGFYKGEDRYLRFYEDGTVLAAQSLEKPEQVAAWINKASPRISTGKYDLHNSTVKFEVTDPFSTLSYFGNINGKELSMTYIIKDGYRGGNLVFRFIEATFLKAD